ncbi:LptA/OstA family protein [Novosphingobium aerophilum]|uniref:LptA/OstA family protein n=1 Tax=Novosphingobium TaxID=165696 RepID=UPI0006C860EC|nr:MULTISPECIES: LptA/OstA family protein [unclassified Novosphingobium]KPH59239.1 OstA family protein [Novosphingobium sp. ST904]MPS71141.1 OstA family protein [Novosphingobium sp.]TCM37658.1 lipopolysaccharide export system protein LptA [Novosphingobium sp. ST904]WRT93410.1 LptA/OstA family protein [Novosphingobium sp. RL4]
MTPRPRLLRIAIAAPVIGLALFAAGQQLGAQGISGHNSDAPVDFGADRIELQDKQGRVVLTGNVDITQADLRLRAARTVMDYTAGNQVQRITASGNVVVTRQDQIATGDTAIYDFNQRIITMVGNATLKRGSGDTLRGGRFVMDLKSGVSSASGGRVQGTFNVPKKKN